MEPQLRIAILECDTPLDNTKAKYQGYGGVFRQLLERSAKALEPTDGKPNLELSIYNIVEHEDIYPNLNDVDAILLTGSKHNSFDNVPWINKLVDFVKDVLAQDRVRVIGVCFGHQIVGRALGLKVDRGDKGWEVSVTPVELTAEGQRLFKQDKLKIFQMHKDIVYTLDTTHASSQQLGRSPVCENQGMYLKGKYITVQGHPEFTRDIVEEILTNRHNQGIFSDELYEDGIRRLEDHDDGVAVGQAFLRFLLED